MRLWHEVKQRRITQIVIAYLAGGWMVLAVIDQVVDREVLPPVVYEVTLTLYLVGILAALIIGWYHGEKGAQEATKTEIAMLVAVGILGIGLSAQVIRSAISETQLEDVLESSNLREIAVLYFEDVSSSGSMQATADAVTEGLISSLSRINELDVSSRNAAREIRNLGLKAADSIAKVLDVGAVVDGTVDEVGDELRVRVRFLEGETGTPLFTESYSWPSDQVASVSTELAREVASTLREQLGVELRLREGRAEAPSAAAWLQVARAERQLKNAQQAIQQGDGEAAAAAFEAAEAELAAARQSAPEWAKPLVLQSEVTYEQYVFAQSLEEFRSIMDQAADYATEALDIQPTNAEALALRGTAVYRRWLFGADEEDTREDLLRRAQEDLEQSVTLDPSLAAAHSTLSHLYYQTEGWTEAVLAAREAYNQDAFLDVIDGVLWRLTAASYDLGDYEVAREWCEEGQERFPRDFRFVQCQILVMTMPAAQPDVDQAWQYYEELEPLLTQRTEFYLSQARMMIGSILGRAGLADSAQAVFRDARQNSDVDPDQELVWYEAAMRSVMGDEDGAIDALQRYARSNDDVEFGNHWFWQNIRSRSEFQRLERGR